MKNLKIIVMSLLLCLLFIPAVSLAGPVEIWSVGQDFTTFQTSCSSSTATEIRPVNSKRLSLILYHKSAPTLYIASSAVTSVTNLLPLDTTTYLFLDVNPPIGAIYGLTQAGQDPVTVYGLETTR